ncbi:D-alanyl-D-alanine carboxypeptidase [Lentilactobacillus kefiri]|uniref:Uncharacterized protein n=1 Tax=Lentilactobacillus kefiri TaxID=33962 RepID=A0A511DWF4_LENKE|nr:D-alanyl-D-alanine carboxypeptidase [Lentilactobacillus kefiri]MCP9369976.1 D-alanyl-D-alanine carboxypeptidase [Lentilactobacillus kefiri]MDH5109275.1 D-alanyl-D-alanine carboxypeptidase [Lentilactobacillus kefiri]MDM7493688.1 D-alanyl-D-alanine carboxypeptidase [Lentilactobacillus kefiri]QGV24517.1 D-alanyl-D-alanine carboxypeptidase [Lentilactobacillus kefiri]UOD78092.1 D-alanyl-D-alanine carboxypeptidase [Lentilactobacillus kefiri]
MKKSILFLVSASVALGIIGTVTPGMPVQASARYYWVKSVNRDNLPYHATSHQSAYIYNPTHTRKLHNLKNYPNTTWYVSKSILMRSSYTRKKGVYYYVTNGAKTISGIVWRGYLINGANPNTTNPSDNNSGTGGKTPNNSGSQTTNETVTGNGITQSYLSLTGSTIDSSLKNLTTARQAAYSESHGNPPTTSLAEDAAKNNVNATGLHEKYIILDSDTISDLEDDNADKSIKISNQICASAIKKQFNISSNIGISTFVNYYGYDGGVMNVSMIILYRDK